jgi:TolB-like protein
LITFLAILVGAAVAILIAIGADAETNPRSIAVMPFVNLSTDPEGAYFVAGVHEDILNRLAQVPGLTVVARSSVVRYADSDKPLEEIAKELNVASILEGSVRPAGSRVRITAQLVDGVTSHVLWSETYDRELTDIFGVQSDIANELAGAVDAALSQESPAQ